MTPSDLFKGRLKSEMIEWNFVNIDKIISEIDEAKSFVDILQILEEIAQLDKEICLHILCRVSSRLKIEDLF